jgi:hypothetical protein
MPGVGDFDTLGQQALATALAATAEDGAPALGLHPSAKAELPLARALAWLIGAFHRFLKTGAKQDTLLTLSVNLRKRPRAKPAKNTKNFQHLGISAFQHLPSSFTAVVPRRFGKVRQNRSSEAPGKDRSPLPTAK